MNADIYVRQSVDETEGIDRQLARCRKLIEARGWTVAHEWRDNDTSASKARGQSTGWGQMLGSDADVVVAVDLDRLLRDVRDLSTLIDTGKKVVTIDGEIDLTSADGEFRATMLAGIARFEVRRKSERQRRANDARASKGQWVGGRRPFGFDVDGMTVREDEAQAIRDGFAAYLAGVSLQDIANDWNARGFFTGQMRHRGARDEKGKCIDPSPWSRSGVREVLMNPRHNAKVVHRGEIVGEAAWPRTVDAEVFEAVQAKLAGRMGATTGGRTLLSGIALCGICGATLHGGGNARKGVPGYRCSGALGHIARMAQPVDDHIDKLIAARLDMPDAATLVAASDASPEVIAQADALRARRASLGGAFADGMMTAEQVRVATERIDRNLAALDAQIADAGRARALSDVIGNGALYLTLPTSRRRAIIDALVEVTVLPPGRGTRTFRPETVLTTWKDGAR